MHKTEIHVAFLKRMNIHKYSSSQLLDCVSDVSVAERDEMKRKSVKEGESVTLDPGVMKTQMI